MYIHHCLAMPPKPETGSVSEDEEQGSTHPFGCTGKPPDGKQCPAWILTWLPKRVPRGFMERLFMCGFCAATEVARFKAVPPQPIDECSKMIPLFHADTNEMYGRRDNIRIFSLEEATDEDLYQNVVEVAQQLGLEISKNDISVCHRVPSR